MDNETAAQYIAEDCRDRIDNIVAQLNAPFFVENDMFPIRLGRDCVEIGKKINSRDINGNAFWHGGVIYGVMDHAFALLVNIDGIAVGQGGSINYYRPGRGEVITAKASFINVSKSLYHVNVEAYDGEKMVASGTFVAFRLNEIRH
ncbi:MAG: PaaI family thioesterase [archaeon]|nr:PaaI family thioesterase [archaeon]